MKFLSMLFLAIGIVAIWTYFGSDEQAEIAEQEITQEKSEIQQQNDEADKADKADKWLALAEENDIQGQYISGVAYLNGSKGWKKIKHWQ